MTSAQHAPGPATPTGGSLMSELDALAGSYGNRFLLEPAPDHRLPEHGMPRRRRHAADRRGAGARRHPDAQPGHLRDDLDGARGATDHRREPPPQLHRPRRVPADRRDRAALHPDARRPLPRPGRDDRHAHPGLVGGDHARRAVAEVEVARAARGGRQGHRRGRTSCSAATCTWSGRSSAATSTSSRASSRSSPTSTRSGPRTWSRTSTRTRSASPRSWARRSPATPTTSSGSTTCSCASRTSAGSTCPLHVDAASGGFVWPFLYPRLRVGLPARAGPLDQRLRATSSASSTPGSAGWCSASRATCPRTSSSTRTTWARRDATFTLNFSTGSAMVLAQYYNFVRFGHDGYRYIMETMQANARLLAERIADDRRLPADRRRRRGAAPARGVPAGRGPATTTSSTSRRSWPPSAAGWSPRTRCRPTPTT